MISAPSFLYVESVLVKQPRLDLLLLLLLCVDPE